MVAFSERLLSPVGAARPDWQIIAGVGQSLGFEGFDYHDRDAVWDEFIGLTAGRPCDMSGMTAARLREAKNLQWPCPTVGHPGTPRRYLNGVFPRANGRARLIAHDYEPPREAADAEFPLVLSTGRIYAHWHTLTRTGKSDKLLLRDGAPYVELHPEDADRLGINEGDVVSLQSRRGVIRLPARLSQSLRPGLLFAPFHWGDLWGEERAVNYLSLAALDPHSKQPELKFCAITAERDADSAGR
jgi:ferredoxin-nitrate reductase